MTILFSGESGLGKSTLINSMFLADIYSNEYPGPSHRIKKTVQVETSKVLLKEKGVNLTLTVVDTPGFGDAVDNSNWYNIFSHYYFLKFMLILCYYYTTTPQSNKQKTKMTIFYSTLDKFNKLVTYQKSNSFTIYF